ncbi:YbaB/EbfC family nucleoid-associated protein [Fodinicola feengrottensis]|uniref:YbaB/EbfC family DNA-binding protein n=1 Tax=Fodinicola feengrottensis TaxID=435914 RepID=A0ABN2HCV4_9ACTN|nr:YbaB/EbfC family nucleoid-associated protein [Fodinicola feengrottensis]
MSPVNHHASATVCEVVRDSERENTMATDDELTDFLRQAQEITAQVRAAGERMAQREIVGVCEGGAVQVTMTPAGEIRSVRIAPNAVDLDNLRRLERQIAQAMQNALENVRGVAEQMVRPLAADLSKLADG